MVVVELLPTMPLGIGGGGGAFVGAEMNCPSFGVGGRRTDDCGDAMVPGILSNFDEMICR